MKTNQTPNNIAHLLKVHLPLTALSGILFFVDLHVALDLALGVTYLAVVLMSLLTHRPSDTFIWSSICTVLVMLGYYLAPETANILLNTFHSGLAICAIWSVAIVSMVLFERSKRRGELEAQLKISEYQATLGQVAEYASDAIIIADTQGRITWVNKGFTQVSGYTLEEVLGKKPGDVLQGKDSCLTNIQKLSTAIKSGEKIDLELLNYHKNGAPYWVDMSIDPVYENNILTKYIAVERDITRRKLLEISLLDQAKQAASPKRTNDAVSNAHSEAQQVTTHTHSKKILIAEDNKVNALVLTKLLKSLGYDEYDLAKNGQEAVELAAQHRYWVVLMDNHMPVMTGIEATQIIHQRQPHLPIIACTADTGEEARNGFLNAGAIKIIYKPLKKSILAQHLESIQQKNEQGSFVSNASLNACS